MDGSSPDRADMFLFRTGENNESAGEQILSLRARTSPEQFQKDVRSSRLGTAQICAQVCDERFSAGNPIETFIQGSAVGYYHVGEKYSNEVYTEESGGGTEGEMAILVREWEAAAKLSEDNSTRKSLFRLCCFYYLSTEALSLRGPQRGLVT